MNRTIALRVSIVLGATMFAAAPFAVTGAMSQAGHQVQVPVQDLQLSTSYSASAGLVP